MMDWIGICLLTMPIFVPVMRQLGFEPDLVRRAVLPERADRLSVAALRSRRPSS
jgi:hypothetical protein